jgi:hypothetical protein
MGQQWEPEWDLIPWPPSPRYLSQPTLPGTAFVPGLPAPDTFPSLTCLGQLSSQAQQWGQHGEPEWDPTWPRAFVPGHLSQPNLPRTAFLGLPAPDTFPSPTCLGQLSSQASRPQTPFPAQLAWDIFRPILPA